MDLTDMYWAVNKAKGTIRNADSLVATMAGIIRGRLKHGNVGQHILTDLKRELRDWDMNRKRWIR